MSFEVFSSRILERGATDIKRDRDAKTTSFVFEGKTWVCTDKARPSMTAELADGYELAYCIKQYCTPNDRG